MKTLKSCLAVLIALVIVTGCKKDEKPRKDFTLDPLSFTFESGELYAYTPELKTFTVTNTGNVATGNLTIALEGTGSGDFELSKYSIPSLNPGQNATFTVAPLSGLKKATYQATVSIFAGADVRSCNITFVVTDFFLKKL